MLLLPKDRRQLLAWFRQHQRPMPWRESRDAYRIWVSEVMLQQTTVATVAKRFTSFIQQFPDVRRLAEATEQAVLREWEGLGYYSRARNLHRAAKIIVEQHDGILPNDEVVWASLPGVGRYILGAVLSQAFDRRLPVVEANTRRVLARLGANHQELATKSMQDWLWQTATDILPKTDCGDFNQAMMELGSLVCTVNEPACTACPLQRACAGFQQGIARQLPVIHRKEPPTPLAEICVLLHHEDRLYVRQRPATGRWANMWEFPTKPCPEKSAWLSVCQELLQELALSGEIRGITHESKYTVTKFRVTMIVIDVRITTDYPKTAKTGYDNQQWLTMAELADYPISSPQRKLLRTLSQPRHVQREQRGLFE